MTESIFGNLKAESILNREGNILPFGLYNPETDGKLSWVCGEDKDNKITSVFDFCNSDGSHEKKCVYLENINQAIFCRDELVKAGWDKMVPPEIKFKFPGEDEDRPLNRQEKRILKKKLSQMNKNNPFDK